MKKTISIILCLSVFLVGGIFATSAYKDSQIKKIHSITNSIPENFNKLPVNEICNQYSFDPYDLEKMVGCYDYMFVAYVDNCIGTYYENARYTESGRLVASPFTKYEIKVIKNIKGELKTDSSLPISMYGGLNIDKKSVTMVTNTSFPIVGNYYLILAYTNIDGELFIGEPNCCLLLNDITESDFEKFSENIFTGDIEKYVEAYKNQDTSVKIGTSYKSLYDISKSK